MRYLCGRPEEVFESLCKDHGKKSPFYVVLSTAEHCEAVRELARTRFGRDSSPGRFSSRHSGRSIDWIVAMPERALFGEAQSCAIEEGSSNASTDLNGVSIPTCLAIMRVYWGPGSMPPRVDKTVDKLARGARTCTCYGSVVFLMLFFIAVLWEWMF